jgi:galactofuranosylgalactofuranosylrhamnosyl-N-acetylglucosaminyl-diphospho-decaprenol beta-1,5/1,6-galactofuranosyltransferase
MRVLQRIVLPRDRDLDVLPLYVDSGAAASNPRAHPDDDEGMLPLAGTETSSTQHPENIIDRFRLRIPGDTRVSFATYFNAFPASYWRMWSILDAVTLRVRLSGSGTVVVYRSTSDGRSQRVASAGTETAGDALDGRPSLTQSRVTAGARSSRSRCRSSPSVTVAGTGST